MPVEYVYWGLFAIFGLALVFVTKYNHSLSQKFENIANQVKENSLKTAEKPATELVGRMAELERRMEVTEADCKRYLARANTRMRRAEQLVGEEDDDEGEASAEQIQEAIALMQNGNMTPMVQQTREPEQLTIQQLRDIARQRA